jgi:hypothetical protein
MLEQMGPQRFWSELRAEAPHYAKLLPELPRLLYDDAASAACGPATSDQGPAGNPEAHQSVAAVHSFTAVLGICAGSARAMQLIHTDPGFLRRETCPHNPHLDFCHTFEKGVEPLGFNWCSSAARCAPCFVATTTWSIAERPMLLSPSLFCICWPRLVWGFTRQPACTTQRTMQWLGRSLPLAVVIATTFATWFGSETVLGVSARFIDGNLGALWLRTRSGRRCAWCWWAFSLPTSSTRRA